MLKTKSAILAVVHETAIGLHKAGVMDRATLREFDGPPLAGTDQADPRGVVVQSGGLDSAVEHQLFHPIVSPHESF